MDARTYPGAAERCINRTGQRLIILVAAFARERGDQATRCLTLKKKTSVQLENRPPRGERRSNIGGGKAHHFPISPALQPTPPLALMDFFSLMNLGFLGNTRAEARQVVVHRGAARRAALMGPQRPPGIRRRRPQSKSCANAKRSAANERKRRHQQKAESAKDSMKLQEQIRQLDEQLALMNARNMVARQNAQGAAYNVMRVYFERIVRGFDPIRHPEQADATLQFFNAAFVKDLKTNDFTGREKYLEQWQLVNECHANVGCEAASIDVYPITDECLGGGGEELERHVNAVKSCGVTTLQISRTTIERIFPHILSDEPLVQSLIGKKYSFTFTLIAYVNECDGRIFQTESTIDLTSALLDMLQDPFVTIKMVDAAAMTKRGNLLLMDDVHEDQNVIENGFL